jgi:hypothetical protein
MLAARADAENMNAAATALRSNIARNAPKTRLSLRSADDFVVLVIVILAFLPDPSTSS